MRYRLVVADVDGTLVHRGGDIPPETRAAVAEYRARGGAFTLATGRPVAGVRHYARQLDLDLPGITFNGAVIYDFRAERVLYRRELDPGLARRALALAREYPVDAFLYDGEAVLVERLTPRVERYMQKDRVSCTPVGDLPAHLDRTGLRPPKLLFFGEVAESLRLMERLRAEGWPVNWVQSDANFVELLPPGASKGAALEWLAARLGVPLEAVMAVGDHHNDLELLRRAGLGVAVANAQPEVRARAGWVTAAPYGLGVAEALRLALDGGFDGAPRRAGDACRGRQE